MSGTAGCFPAAACPCRSGKAGPDSGVHPRFPRVAGVPRWVDWSGCAGSAAALSEEGDTRRAGETVIVTGGQQGRVRS